MVRPVPLDDLEAERDEWARQMARAAEQWVQARAAGLDTQPYDEQQRKAEREYRRLERRIRRRSR